MFDYASDQSVAPIRQHEQNPSGVIVKAKIVQGTALLQKRIIFEVKSGQSI
jgi:hypothetical protein